MTLGELADWASVVGLLLTVANSAALFWIVRRTQFNLSADQIVKRLDALIRSLGQSLAVTDSNRSEVLATARRCESMMRGVRRLVDRTTKRSTDEAMMISKNLIGALEARANYHAADTEAVRLYGVLQGLKEDIISLRDRRRASP